MNYCPQCAQALGDVLIDGEIRKGCSEPGCGYVLWNNPTPVVAMIVEVEGGVVLAHNAAWKHNFYSIITGFLECREDPKECAQRETEEELGLTVRSSTLVGVYPFAQQNQVIIAYHVEAEGEITLNHELDDYKIIPKDKLKGWDMGTGLAINDWLASQ
ncbi:NADH pyrophosphatase [Sinobacterium norvegicum]|uniref:NADH pyrophosphatase n=1 Tax=Sinobacterium norvegicum TaxID=1641715 RepID=A0ABN8ELQ6_9GAMM|nr:NUDIX domain-containing protein [Sinobacterium norvegicum]CAH0992100.1 NADH pyrophosphatase [Sinobacterium norvegicum]